jgi:hypothetical protein
VSQRLPYANHLSNFDMQVDDRLIGVNEPIVFFLNVFLMQCRSQTHMKVTVSNEQKKNHAEKITRTKLKTRQVKKRWKSTSVINFSREKCVTVMKILKTLSFFSMKEIHEQNYKKYIPYHSSTWSFFITKFRHDSEGHFFYVILFSYRTVCFVPCRLEIISLQNKQTINWY